MSTNVGQTLATLDEATLEAALRGLAQAVEVPPTPDLARMVGARLREPTGPRRLRATQRFNLRWALIVALIALVVLAGIAAAIGFGLPGLRISFVPPTASPVGATASPRQIAATPSVTSSAPPSTASPRITLSPITGGVPTSLEAARSGVPFRVLVPSPDEVGGTEPLIYLDRTVPDGEVLLIYPASATLAAPSDAPIGPDGRPVAIVITESRGSIDEAILGKVLGPGTTVTAVDVGGTPGLWITGKPHALLVLDASGRVREETLREVGSVLAWVDGGTLVRIESGLTLEATLEIARSMR